MSRKPNRRAASWYEAWDVWLRSACRIFDNMTNWIFWRNLLSPRSKKIPSSTCQPMIGIFWGLFESLMSLDKTNGPGEKCACPMATLGYARVWCGHMLWRTCAWPRHTSMRSTNQILLWWMWADREGEGASAWLCRFQFPSNVCIMFLDCHGSSKMDGRWPLKNTTLKRNQMKER